ncbi:MAG: amine oxidase [Actinobacteria bacterium]|nr:MAG: amine oxidase [Actinomycetota bacterium]
MRNCELLIVGAGPTGLGAARRLIERGQTDWELLEESEHVGGQSASFVDDAGFTWDVGGHVLFSRYDRFTRLLDELLGDDYFTHQRQAWIRMPNVWVPYPFQNNIRHLPRATAWECIEGLLDAKGAESGTDFLSWIRGTLGAGIARHFMVPYNEKLWRHPLDEMSTVWLGNMVSSVDCRSVLHNLVMGEDETSFGQNATFKYPASGGTGELFRRFLRDGDQRVRTGVSVVEIDAPGRIARLSDGSAVAFGDLISTMPLPHLVRMSIGVPERLRSVADGLVSNTVVIVGVGVDRPTDSSRSWIYTPSADVPFYRVTYLSNYSANNVPCPDRQHSLMCEVAFRPTDSIDQDVVARETVDGLIALGFLGEDDRPQIASLWTLVAPMAYPVPTRDRDDRVRELLRHYRQHGIHSRGRSGTWRYETGSMDQCVMQGIELVDRLLGGEPETTVGELV